MAKKTKKTTKKATPGKAVKKVAKATAEKLTQKKAIRKKAAPKAVAPAVPSGMTRGVSRGFSLAEAGVVVLTITFRDVAAGNSTITASCNGEESNRTSSGAITFSGVKQNDLILIDGSSPGTTKIEISVPATPAKLEFPAGNFNDSFVID